eukprot:sb/3472830/
MKAPPTGIFPGRRGSSCRGGGIDEEKGALLQLVTPLILVSSAVVSKPAVQYHVFTPVLERARRASKSFSGKHDWSSDDESDDDDDDDDPLAPRSRRNKASHDDLDDIFRRETSQDGDRLRARRKSAAGFLVSYASNKIRMATHSSETYQSSWNLLQVGAE